MANHFFHLVSNSFLVWSGNRWLQQQLGDGGGYDISAEITFPHLRKIRDPLTGTHSSFRTHTVSGRGYRMIMLYLRVI